MDRLPVLVRATLGLLLVLTFAPGASGADAPAGLTAEERLYLDAHGPIRYVTDPHYAPFELLDENGRPVGIQFDLLRALEGVLEHDVEVTVSANWTDALDSMRDGRADLIGALAYTEEREAFLDFTEPYAYFGVAFYAHGSHPEIQTMEDLPGHPIGIVAGYAEGKQLKAEQPELAYVEVNDTLDGLRRLQAGEIHAYFDSSPVAGYYLRSEGFTDIRMLPDRPNYATDSRFAVPDGNVLLLSIIEKGLAALPSDTVSQLFIDWTGADLTVPAPAPRVHVDLRWVAYGLVGLVAVVATVLTWNLSLHRRVRRRTRDLEESRDQLRAAAQQLSEAYEKLEHDVELRQQAELANRVATERLGEIQKLKEVDRYRTTLLSTASHELNTPITPLKLQLHLLGQGTYGALTPEQRRSVGILSRNMDRLSTLVRDILDVARIQGGALRVNPRPLDLVAIVREATDPFHEAAAHAQVRLEVRTPVALPAEADSGRLTQVIVNLVDNALKFTPAGGRVEVEAAVFDGEAVVYVHDTGPGVSEEQRARLFQAFSQVHDPGQATRTGTGLGLFISKSIVEQHRGRIWCESRGPGHGSSFGLALPLQPVLATPPAAVPSGPRGGGPSHA